MSLIVVTGMLRSGTSAVAQVLQAMRIPVALAIVPPLDPINQFDWEDFASMSFLGESVQRYLDGNRDYEFFAEWFVKYLNVRAQAVSHWHDLTGKRIDNIAVKSPLYSLFLPAIRDICESLGMSCTVIQTHRGETSRRDSLRRTHGMVPTIKRIHEIDAKIEVALSFLNADLNIDLGDLRRSPDIQVNIIADVLGVTCPKLIQSAIAVVQEDSQCPGSARQLESAHH